MPAYFGGTNIFGTAIQCRRVDHPPANQVITFFGVNGTVTVFGGSRGRLWNIQGVLVGVNSLDIAAQEALIDTYNDGLARVFTDTYGTNWAAVVYRGGYQQTEKPGFTENGIVQPYRMSLHGLV